jgi:hypothetical protein
MAAGRIAQRRAFVDPLTGKSDSVAALHCARPATAAMAGTVVGHLGTQPMQGRSEPSLRKTRPETP